MMNERYYKVYNRCKYQIGVQLLNNRSMTIFPNSFQLLSADDILYIESICRTTKFFVTRMLVAVDSNGNEVSIQELGLPVNGTDHQHMNDDEIIAMLKKPVKQVDAWLADIDDPAELHAIYLAAKSMDLSSAKLKVLMAKMPNKDLLGD